MVYVTTQKSVAGHCSGSLLSATPYIPGPETRMSQATHSPARPIPLTRIYTAGYLRSPFVPRTLNLPGRACAHLNAFYRSRGAGYELDPKVGGGGDISDEPANISPCSLLICKSSLCTRNGQFFLYVCRRTNFILLIATHTSTENYPRPSFYQSTTRLSKDCLYFYDNQLVSSGHN